MVGRRVNTEADFWDGVDIRGPEECWPWAKKAHFRNGYGAFKMAGKMWKAHRLAYTLTIGDIPAGMNVCHTCDSPPCCNPMHFFLGDHIANVADRHEKGRTATKDRHAKRLHPPKLTWEQAQVIRGMAGSAPHEQIAQHFGVSRRLVSRIIAGDCWKDYAPTG
jgi:hypothetical protein